ncbi:MAG: hypothetical protein D3904_08685 [Candidatus Electrothrix sp. EH2]|nr:hypothetical protein [Candidatus Electrothrix sp. EH2]
MSTTKFFLAVIALAMVSPGFHIASAASLNADTKKSERNYRKTKTGEGALTQKMIEDCIKLKTEINEEFEKISAAKKKFDELNNEVNALDASLKVSKAQLNQYDEKDIDGYNKQVKLYNNKLQQYNNKLEELQKAEEGFNKKSAPYQAKAAQLERECNGQPYYEDDHAAVAKKTGKTL